MTRTIKRKKKEKREKLIGIVLLALIIFGMLCTSSVFANGNNIDENQGNDSEIIPVTWSRTPEPQNDTDYISIYNNDLFNNKIAKSVDMYSLDRAEIELYTWEPEQSDIPEENIHSLTLKISGRASESQNGTNGHISKAKIYYADGSSIEINASNRGDINSELNKFIFTGKWHYEENNTQAYSDEKGASATVKFNGVKIELYGYKSSAHGIVDIILDEEKYYDTEIVDGNSYTVINNYPEGLNEGKVLTTPAGIYTDATGNRILFEYDAMTNLLNPTEEDKVWDSNYEDENGNKSLYYEGYIKNSELSNYPVNEFATWKHYGGDSWRLFRGTFELKKEQLTNKRVYIGVLGENGPELIMPLNDFMIVLVDGKPTDINFTTQILTEENKDNIKFRFGEQIYTPTFKRAYHKNLESLKCTDPNHTSISKHTDTWHAHLNDMAESSESGYRLGDITPFLNDGNEHKIEVLCADNTGGGGGTKLDVFLVDAPSMKIEKGGFVLDDTKDGDDKKVEIGDDSHVYPGEAVYYTLSMTNNGIDRLNTLEFNDELINIKINSAGIYNLRTGENLNIDGLKITKISKSGDGTETNRVTKTADKALELLNELYPNETVIVEDLNNIKYEVTQEDLKRPNKQIVNTVIGTAKYLNNQLTAEAEASFKVTVEELIKPMVAITKEVFKVKRGGTIIYSAEDSAEESSVVPGLYPGDEVSFYFTITNKTNDPARPYNKDLPVTNLSLTDSLSSPYTNPEWEFTCYDILEFNYNNFDLKPKQTIKVIASTWVVPEPFDEEDEKINVWDYNVINTVNLFKGYNDGKVEKLDEATANVKILPPKLYLKKVITNLDKDKDSSNRIFTINIKGNDGSKFTIEAKVEEVYTIDNLRYGVTYTVDEVVPANYQLSDIKFKEAQSGDTEVSIENSGISIKNSGIQLVTNNRDINVNQGIINAKDGLITVINNVVNDNYFYDDAVKTNTFKYPLDSSKN